MTCWNARAARVSGGFLAASVLWVLGSDHLVTIALPAGAVASAVQSSKGLLFVIVASLLGYGLLARHANRIDESQRRREEAYDQTLAGWAAALDLRDHSTAEHTLRVTSLTERLAASVGISGGALVNVRRGATLHDIGKMGVPDSILGKSAPLTEDEWCQMRLHPALAVEFLGGIEYLSDALDIPWCHHEKWDGTGYPRGLKGEQIPLAARLFAVVDVFDAVTSVRPYRSPMTIDEAMALIRVGSGTHFDPEAVAAFESLVQHRFVPELAAR